MKYKKKRLLQALLVNDICWGIAAPFVYVAKRLALSRVNYKNRKNEDENIALCDTLFFKQEVKNGLFKGLRFNNIKPTGSSIYSKLLGSYELELEPVMQNLLTENFSHLINIGCDEGYYAVGIARILPGINVIAFDCNKNAQEKCKALAVLNNVRQQIEVKGCFAEKDISSLKNAGKTLFIIDCEGCEENIITQKLIADFATASFVIELHYQQAPLILETLQQMFSSTHRIILVKALSDHERIMQFRFAELEGLSYQQKEFIVTERNNYMEWFIATPLQ
jgi:precorrin-6B methylase 2